MHLGRGGCIHGKARRDPRLRDQTVNDGILWVGIGPIIHGDAARRLAKDGDLGAVAAEGGDVVAHPFDCKPLVEETDVLGQVWRAGEAEDIDPVVEGYNDDILGGGEVLSIVEGRVGAAKVEF